MSSQPSIPIGEYADYLNVADVAAAIDGIDDECVRSAIQSISAEMSYRLGVSIRTLMDVTSITTSDISPYIYREPVPTQNLRLTNIAVSDGPVEPVTKKTALVMAVLETRRRFLEDV